MTGRWAGKTQTRNACKIVDIMRMYDLFAVSTSFRPRKRARANTYMFTKSKSNPHGDLGFYVGERVKCKYKGRVIGGSITSVDLHTSNRRGPRWTIKFDDGYVAKFSRNRVRKMLAKEKTKKKKGRQIDYILVSNRWRSCVTDCKVKWGPTLHLSL